MPEFDSSRFEDVEWDDLGYEASCTDIRRQSRSNCIPLNCQNGLGSTTFSRTTQLIKFTFVTHNLQAYGRGEKSPVNRNASMRHASCMFGYVGLTTRPMMVGSLPTIFRHSFTCGRCSSLVLRGPCGSNLHRCKTAEPI